jgi:predicted dehydrogenase
MMIRGKQPTRRTFLFGAAGLALASRAARSAVGSPDASGRFATGHVGLGQRGAQLLESPGIDPRAFFDVDREQITRAAPSARAGARSVGSIDELLALSELDAVLIATPDHNHTRLAIAAIEAGKDVFLESPCIWQPYESKALLAATRRWGAVVQSGEILPYTRAAAELRTRLAALPPGTPLQVTCRAPKNPEGGAFTFGDPPAGFDWVQWLGQTEARNYNPDYAHRNWRYMLDWGGGHIRALGTTQLATLLWALGIETPAKVSVQSSGAAPASGLWDCPPDFGARINIDGRLTVNWEQAELTPEEAPCAMRIEGAGETMTLQGLDEQALLHGASAPLAPAGWQEVSPIESWTTCMTRRAAPLLPLATACSAATLTQLAVWSWRLATPLEYDFATARVTNSELVNRLMRARPGASYDAAP